MYLVEYPTARKFNYSDIERQSIVYWTINLCFQRRHRQTKVYICTGKSLEDYIVILESSNTDSTVMIFCCALWSFLQLIYSLLKESDWQHVWGQPHACLCYVLSHVRLFVTSWTIDHQVPLSMELSRQEYWSGLPLPPPGDLPDPGIESVSPLSPALQADSLSNEP